MKTSVLRCKERRAETFMSIQHLDGLHSLPPLPLLKLAKTEHHRSQILLLLSDWPAKNPTAGNLSKQEKAQAEL